MKIKPAILFLSLAVILFSFFNITCKDSGMNLFDRSFSITTEDVSCTEVWLKIKIGPGNYDREVILKRDTVVLFRRTINELETTIIDTNLLPNHTYTYTAQLLNNSQASNSTAQTMDTTSHAWSFTTTLLGNGISSSSLHDVAIINDTCIWAVGEIHRNDTVFNAAKWNGQDWELKKISVNYKSNWITLPLDGIFAFSATDIWVVGSFPIHGDGNSWTLYHLQDMGLSVSVSKAWGTSSSSIYFVGLSGSIAHYNGSSWTKIESGNNLQFLDIYGSGGEILAVCTQNYPPGQGIFSITGNSATQISAYPIDPIEEFFGVWFVPNRHYYIVGDGIYEKNSLLDNTWKNGPLDITPKATTKMRGNGLNDAFVVGAFGECLHYNGVTWKSFIAETGFSSGAYGSVAVRGNLVIMTGSANGYAVITIGKR